MTTNRTMTTNLNETAGTFTLPATEWLLRQPDARTAWETCRRGDWMLYQLGATRQVSRQRLVACACECARLALRYAQAGDDRPRIAIETAEAWCRGGGTPKQLRAARSDAHAAAHDAADAALAATYAARAAAAAADAATFAADAATFAAAAAAAAEAADYGARAATYVAAAAATNAATNAAAYAARAAAANAATYAARAAAANAANLDAAEDSRRSVLAQCADIVRAFFTLEDLQ